MFLNFDPYALAAAMDRAILYLTVALVTLSTLVITGV